MLRIRGTSLRSSHVMGRCLITQKIVRPSCVCLAEQLRFADTATACDRHHKCHCSVRNKFSNEQFLQRLTNLEKSFNIRFKKYEKAAVCKVLQKWAINTCWKGYMFTERKVTDICSLQIHGRIFGSFHPVSMRFARRKELVLALKCICRMGVDTNTRVFKSMSLCNKKCVL